MARKIKAPGLDLLKASEGCKLKAYQDGGGVWTIGYGHTGKTVVPGLVITQAQAEKILKADLEQFCAAVESLVVSPLTDNQFDALVVFVFNIGISAFQKSTMLLSLNRGDYAHAAGQFKRWNRDNGKIIPGLTARRLKEETLFNTKDKG